MNFLSSLRRTFTPGFIVFTVVLLILAFSLSQFLAISLISGHSMDPTLADHQIMMCFSAQNIPFLHVSRGDIVSIYSQQLDKFIIKRVIGMPGDQLQLVAGQLYLNGTLQHEPYIYEPMLNDSYGNSPLMTVPEGHYFVMGDNRNISLDSRSLGFIPQEEVKYITYPHHQMLSTLIFFAILYVVIYPTYQLGCWVDQKFGIEGEEDSSAKKELQATA